MHATPAKERLAFLDVARGLAAMLVLVEHGLEQCLPGYLDWSLLHFNLGRIGVILFLLVSGFIIPVSLEQGGSNARFWLRRCFRLFPLYWLSIALAGCYVWLGGSAVVGVPLENSGEWFINATMLQGFFSRPHVWEVFWTLQLELVIYGACSFLFATTLLQRTTWLASLALAGCALLGVSKPLLLGQPFDVGGMRFLYFAPLIGLVAQRQFASRDHQLGIHQSRSSGQAERLFLPLMVAGQAAMLLLVWSVNHFLFPQQIQHGALWDAVFNWMPAYCCFFILLGLRNRPLPEPACWLGRVSYSIYLLHPFVLALLLSAACPRWALLPALIGGTLSLSAATYKWVETPCIALGRRLERRWWPRPARINAASEMPRQAA